MYISMTSAECKGRVKIEKKKVNTIVLVHNFEDFKNNYNNIMMNDIVIFSGNIQEFIDSVTPDNAKNVFLKIEANPDIMNLDILAKLKEYNILCNVPGDYSNMEQLYNINKVYPNIRFCGGKLALIDGVNIGLYDIEKPKRFVFNDLYSCQEDVKPLSDFVDYIFVQHNKTEAKIKTPVRPKVVDDKPKAKKTTNKIRTGGLSMF